MKIVAFLSLVFSFQSFGSVLSQNVSLSLNNATVETFFLEIHNQTGCQYFYDEDVFDKSFRVTINESNISIEDALEKTLGNQNVDFALNDNTIMITRKKETENKPVEQLLQDDEIKVLGLVKDESGIPIPGVSVYVKGTTIGTSTNEKGEFIFIIPASSRILVVSMIGKETQEVIISGDVILFKIELKDKVDMLDAVQIIAYGTTTRRLSTSSVSSVETNIIEKQSVSNPIQALQGRASGMYVTNTAGSLGASPSIQIRGVGTLNTGVSGANQPLFIVDGAIISGSGIVASPSTGNLNDVLGSYWGQEAGMNPFNFLNPNDIESIDVLKDADATSIYGSRGTNGVVIITTKRGKAGATKFNFDVNTGITQAAYVPARLSTEQYLQMRRDAFAMGNNSAANALNPIEPTSANAPDLVDWDQNAYTDWSDFEYGNPARNFSFQGNVSGGSKDLNFLTSIGYTSNEDITRGDPFQKRISGLLNLNFSSFNGRFQLSLSNNISMDNLKPSTATLVFPATLRGLPPNMPLTEEDGSPFWPTIALMSNARNFITNPYAGEFVDTRSKTFSVINNINASYKLLDFVTLKLQMGYTNQLNNSYTTQPSTAFNPKLPGASVPNRTESESKFETINIEPQLTFNKSFGKSKLEGLLGTTFFERNTRTFGIGIDGFETDELLGSWAGGSNVYNKTSTFFKYRFNSVFARANYAYNEKYLLNATFRRDGSSRFGPDNKWADFGSIGWGWIFTNEDFLSENKILSFGKLRGSYGSTGNDNINDFRFTSLFTSTNNIYGDLIGLSASFLSVPGFKWETTTKLDFALELGFIKDRFYVNANWFRNLSTDLLVNQRIPSQTGFGTYLGNFPGVIENKGWEIELITNNLGPNSTFKWRTNFNISFLENSLLEYPDLENSPNSNVLRLGEAIPNPAFPSNLLRTLIFEGVNPETGLPDYKDIDEDGVVSPFGNNDKDFVGTSFPKFYGGLNNSFGFKGFTLDVFFYFAKQLTTNNLYLASTVGQLFNPVADYSGNYWKEPGDVAKYPRLYTGVGAQDALLSNFTSSSAATDEVFFAKLRSVSITYKLPGRWIQNLRLGDVSVYARGQNLFTHTSKDIGKDPEVMNPRGVIPRTIITGINVSF